MVGAEAGDPEGTAVRLALALCLGLAGAASATPPQIVSVEDRLFARNDGTLFLLREMRDNRGRHDVVQVDTLVVFRDIAGGDDRGFRGVARVIDWGESGAPDSGARSEVVPLTEAQDPYDIFADFEAWPLDEPRRDAGGVTLGADGLRVAGGGGQTYRLSVADLDLRIRDTLEAGRGILPVLFAEGGVDPFDPGAFDPGTECVPDGVRRLDPGEPVLAAILCEDAETGQMARLWVVVPETR
jgi:hypothetical protein